MLTDRIASEIQATGPLYFDRFMEMALYDSEAGFFGSGRLRSHRTGDFLTSPEVSPLFGETLARFIASEADRIGGLDAVIDCGAGSGSLLVAALPHLGDVASFAVEVSPAARGALAGALPDTRVVASLDEVGGPLRGVVIANELLDNLPAAVAIRSAEGWLEEAVTVADGRLTAIAVPARPEVAAWTDAHAGEVPVGARVEVQIASGEWLRTALGMLVAGAVVMIDYGDTTSGLAGRRAAGTMRTYRAHHLGPDPLVEPGATDITMDIDFSALIATAESVGATTEYTTQADFLAAWGLRERLSTLRHLELEAARAGSTMERLQLRSRATEAETLLHPRGLGDFRVLVARKQP